MKQYNIKCIHAGIGFFNGFIYFLLDNKLLSMEVCTPNFNDYNEFRISDFRLSNEDYKPEDNEIELTPYDINEFAVDEDEVNFIKKWFTKNYEEMESIPKESPFNYLDPYDNLLVSVNYDTGYRHLINETGSYIEDLGCYDPDKQKWLLTSEIANKKLYEDKGMYRLLTHISDGIFNNYYKA